MPPADFSFHAQRHPPRLDFNARFRSLARFYVELVGLQRVLDGVWQDDAAMDSIVGLETTKGRILMLNAGNASRILQQPVVKLAVLRKELPPKIKWITSKERAAQRAERARLFTLRCLDTLCEVGGKFYRMY